MYFVLTMIFFLLTVILLILCIYYYGAHILPQAFFNPDLLFVTSTCNKCNSLFEPALATPLCLREGKH